jgi:hypothetical protein
MDVERLDEANSEDRVDEEIEVWERRQRVPVSAAFRMHLLPTGRLMSDAFAYGVYQVR